MIDPERATRYLEGWTMSDWPKDPQEVWAKRQGFVAPQPNAAAQHPPAANQEEDVLVPLPHRKLAESIIRGVFHVQKDDGCQWMQGGRPLADVIIERLRVADALAALLLEAEKNGSQDAAGRIMDSDPCLRGYRAAERDLAEVARRKITNIRQEGA